MKIYNSILAFSISVLALANANGQTITSGVTAAPTASSATGNQEFHQGITFNSPGETHQNIEYGGTQTLKNVPSVSGPALTTSNDTCMGSSSGSVSGPGFGLSIGGTWSDTNCKLLKNSRELWNMGMKAAAMALMCTDPANRDALEITGYQCPQTAKYRNNNPQVSSINSSPSNQQKEVTDPFIRARMGLAPLQAKN